jgi:hypothetical protein
MEAEAIGLERYMPFRSPEDSARRRKATATARAPSAIAAIGVTAGVAYRASPQLLSDWIGAGTRPPRPMKASEP